MQVAHVTFDHDSPRHSLEERYHFHCGLVVCSLGLWCPLVFYPYLGINVCKALLDLCEPSIEMYVMSVFVSMRTGCTILMPTASRTALLRDR